MTTAPTPPEQDPLRAGHLAPAPRTLVDLFLETVESFGDAPAVAAGGSVLTYDEFHEASAELAARLAELGIGAGDKVGVRVPSGTADLYVAIMGVLLAGAAYVPVDADDPDERARTVFEESQAAAVVGADLVISSRLDAHREPVEPALPDLADDCWVIFTSGSTGKPKGVAVTHRSAAAFVDAESRLFLQGAPIGPGDRVMAGLSVAFDASCEEMWLAWAHGACLVPAPRSLVRSGVDLGPWLVANDITVVSTVPTLVSMWPAEAMDRVRLLIVGGEACPPELGARFATDTREVWNTYGPTEATVVACAAQVTAEPPVRIGLPLDGWDLAVVDAEGQPVAPGEEGELIIGGVGLARYLDPAKDAEKYAPMPTLGWERAYRSGDVVVNDPAGLLFRGRADDQVKVGGRRIELGEIDSALLQLPGVAGAAAAIRRTESGNTLIVGYLTVDEAFDRAASLARLRADMPGALVPRLAVVPDLPTRTSGKIDRDALPWPLPEEEGAGDSALDETGQWLADIWNTVLGARPTSPDEDFFELGGGSLTAAQIVARVRERYVNATVADVYEHHTIGAFASWLQGLDGPTGRLNEQVPPVGRGVQAVQLLALLGLRTLTGLRWVFWVALGARVLDLLGWEAASLVPMAPWWALGLGWVLLVLPAGRMALAALAARVLLAGVRPGTHPRGGGVHLRLWLAERFADEAGAGLVSGAGLVRWYARLLGCRVGRGVDLHAMPPITGHLTLGEGCAVEPEVDLQGHWVDGATLHVGPIEVGERARIGARSTLVGGARVGADAEVAPGSTVFGDVPAGERWSGSPAIRAGQARGPWADAPRRRPVYTGLYALTGVLISLLPLVATLVGGLVLWRPLAGADSLGEAVRTALLWLPLAGLAGYATLALLILVLVRLAGIGLQGGHHPTQSRRALQAWATLRLMDEARTWLFPMYAGAITTLWLRLLGARMGKDAEASTVLMIPSLTRVGAGAFLADDTLIGGYELGGGWMRVERVKIGRGAFVGNSGMTAPGRKVPKKSLVAVLSAAPRRKKAKAGASWVGSPPEKLRRAPSQVDAARTYAPPRHLRVLRAMVESCRVLALLAHLVLHLLGAAALCWLAARWGWGAAAAASGLVLLACGVLAVLVAVVAKWLLVGRWKPSEHPLWSGMVWRGELADAFVESVAVPWMLRAVPGTALLNLYFRVMGARVGRGVWCETYWLPEHDLIELGAGATVNRGCVVQTHLFHDRVLAMDTVRLRAGSTVGPNSVVLPASTLGRDATVGPGSLVMRGESAPDRTRWVGNPIGPWVED
ncbi:Pls/PosA family non-ribosomal peptide synthetase [Kytococcus sp. HMSC28H12]|uniref:Pls/PosA family non-ribosomal peptide synthetase n=1 Tax=Kytococcus sp. HMSC28H12 TaxID=1581067 RepID=UPI0008A160D5|nr:Pls/PosA family non-ribosomal peptide synthetase [Kytococcus sp. HMSC28H12]OFS11696.1 amino acid adenylation protein [Kytococcus sp. HMSC28H12]